MTDAELHEIGIETDELAALAIPARNDFLGPALIWVPGVGYVDTVKAAHDEAYAEWLHITYGGQYR